MGKTPFSKDSEFLVGDNKLMAYVLAFLFFAIFGYGLFDAIRLRFNNIDYQSYIFTLALLPSIYCLRRAKSRRIYIRVNKKGIYSNGQLVTGWPNLYKVYIAQETKKSFYDLRDNFILVVEYRESDLKKGIRKKIPLTNTQNKSEEEVLEAVQFFWRIYRNDNSQTILR